MAQSFQREKPPARINLFLEVATGDAQEKLELPLRLLVMGDYSGREDSTPVADREILNLNKDNFETVLKSMDIKLDYSVPDTLKGGDEDMKVSLDVDSMKSFSPEEVAKQVPQLNRMMSMRNLLQDLRNRIVSLPEFRKQLEKIVQDDASLEQLAAELEQFVTSEEEGGSSEES